MPRLVGFSRFAALLEEQISDKISRRILSGDQGMIVRPSESGAPEASHATDPRPHRRRRPACAAQIFSRREGADGCA